MSIPCFSDLVETKTLDGDKLRIDDIFNKPIIVIGYKINKSRYNKKSSEFCTTIQFYFEEDEEKTHYIVFTGSQVIKEQIEDVAEALEKTESPFMFKTTITQCGNYVSLA